MDPFGNAFEKGCNRAAKSRYNNVLDRLISKQVYSPCIVDWTVLITLGCAETIEEMLEIKVVRMGGNDEVFSSEAWRCAFDIREPIYTELCHELFSTYEFDEEVADEELISKKLFMFRLGGRGNSLSLLEFARCLVVEKKGVGTQKESMIVCGQFVTKLEKKMQLLTEDVLDGAATIVLR
ncbi:hypothetical protein Tco_1327442 [Tanacetum coccineum]